MTRRLTTIKPMLIAAMLLLAPSSLWANQPVEVKLSYPQAMWDYKMGYAVAITDGTALVAVSDGNPQPGDWPPALFGSILSYRRNSNGWTLEQEFGPVPNPFSPGYYIGSALDVDAGHAVVGLELRDFEFTPLGALLYQRVSGEWIERIRLSTGDENQDRSFKFGTSVAIDGNLVAVGAPDAQIDGNHGGAVYIFEIGPDDVTLQAAVMGDDTTIYDDVGSVVALDGETVAFWGAPNDGVAIYVFVRNPDGTWSQQAKLRPPPEELGSFQLHSLALSGDTLVSGTRPVGSTHKNGVVFVWERVADVWTFSQSVRPDPNGMVYEGFGDAVDLHDDVMIVGAPGADFHPTLRQSAYVFERIAGTWQQRSVLQPRDSGLADRFGLSVATNGRDFIVGATNQWNLAEGNARETGGAYLYEGLIGPDEDGDGVINDRDLCAQTNPGVAVDCEGRPRRDINGDCVVDVLDIDGIASAFVSQGPQGDAIAELFEYPDDRYEINPGSLATNGTVVAFSGRVNGSAPNRIVLLGKVGSQWQEIQQIQSAALNSASFGIDLAMDGNTLAIAGAIENSHGTFLRSVEIYEENEQGWAFVTRLFGSQSTVGDNFGNALDLDGDTLVVGAPNAVNNQGRAYVFERTGGVWNESKVLIPDVVNNARFGKAVATDGNIAVVLGRTSGATPNSEGREIGGYVFERIGNTWSTGEVLVCQLGGSSQSATVVTVDNGRIVIDRSFSQHWVVFTKTLDGWEVTSTLRSNLLNYYTSLISPYALAIEGNNVYAPNGIYPTYPIDAPVETHNNNLVVSFGAIEVFGLQQEERIPATLVPQRGYPEAVRLSIDLAVSNGLLVTYVESAVAAPLTTGTFYMIQTDAIDDGDGVDFDRDVCPLQAGLLLSDCNGRPLYDVNGDCKVDGRDLMGIIAEVLGG